LGLRGERLELRRRAGFLRLFAGLRESPVAYRFSATSLPRRFDESLMSNLPGSIDYFHDSTAYDGNC
jgi:hypothetical protein